MMNSVIAIKILYNLITSNYTYSSKEGIRRRQRTEFVKVSSIFVV